MIARVYLPDSDGSQSLSGAATEHGDSLANKVDREVRRIIEGPYSQAVPILTRERSRLDALVEALLWEESLDEPQVKAAAGVQASSNHLG